MVVRQWRDFITKYQQEKTEARRSLSSVMVDLLSPPLNTYSGSFSNAPLKPRL
jgi:hypothetical protein